MAVGQAGVEWLVDVLHELVHPGGGPNAVCAFLPVDEDLLAAECSLCDSLTADARTALLGELADNGVQAAEQREAARMLFPSLGALQHALLLPVVADGRTAGVLVTVGATAPLAKTGLNRVMDLATNGLRQVWTAENDAAALAESNAVNARTDRELAETRLFLDLQERLVAARTTAEVVGALSSWLGAPVAMQLPNLIVTEAAGDGARDLALSPDRTPVEHELLTRRSVSSGIHVLPASGRAPLRVAAPIPDTESGCAGFLLAGVGQWGREVTRRALAVSRGLIAYQLSVRQDIEASVATLRQRLISDVLEDRPADQLATRAAKLGHDLTLAHIPLTVGFRSGDGPDGASERLLRIVEQAAATASASSAASLLGIVEDSVLGLVPEPVPAGPAALGKTIVAEAAVAGLDVVVGFGPTCSSRTGLSEPTARARWAAQILRDPAVGQTSPVAHVDDLGIYGLLFDHHRSGELHSFALRWLGPLLEYDGKHRSELVLTLRQLFRQRSLTDAAAALHIHISTLKYRIGRIEEILGRSVEDWDNVFHLELALRVLAVTDPTAFGER
ncbi:MAG: PucR family transcriptional regulator [Sporichthyaceae bacterium]